MHKYARPSYTNESMTVAVARIAIAVIMVIAMVAWIGGVMKNTADQLHDKTVELNNDERP